MNMWWSRADADVEEGGAPAGGGGRGRRRGCRRRRRGRIDAGRRLGRAANRDQMDGADHDGERVAALEGLRAEADDRDAAAEEDGGHGTA